MSNLTNRVNKLENSQGMGKRMKYMCVITEGWASGMDTPEERAKGYKIQPYIQSAGGTGGKPFYLATEAELQEFAARDDVELFVLRVGYKENPPPVAGV